MCEYAPLSADCEAIRVVLPQHESGLGYRPYVRDMLWYRVPRRGSVRIQIEPRRLW
jgi:hypothetical protein